METVLIDSEWLAVKPPRGFAPIPHDELEALMGISYDCMWGMRDPTRHMLVSVTWKDSNRLITKLGSEKVVAKRVDETFAKRYRKGGYHCEGHFERAVAGASAQAHGFRFSYTVEGIAQEGEVLVFKRDIRCYTLSYYTRTQVAAENHPIFESIVASLEVR
ncbi:MAG: hypothetical protein IJ087_21185 [Eggerthellaceae bacterium]|nr:hypothetical protein [Eggerthellaceae bacterium]